MERSDYQKRVLVGLRQLLLHLDGRPKRLGHEGRNLATMSAIDSKTDTVVQEPRRAVRWTRGARSQQRKEQA